MWAEVLQRVVLQDLSRVPPPSSVCFLTTNSKIDIQQFLDANRASPQGTDVRPSARRGGPWFQVPSSESTALYCTAL